jgi:UMF1 family MFS transporter
MLWGLTPDGANLLWMLFIFYVGFFAAESALNFVNAILPSLGTNEEVGRISGSGAAFGYWVAWYHCSPCFCYWPKVMQA